MQSFSEVATEVLIRCDRLSEITQTDGIIDRQYLTKQHKHANSQVAKWMQEAGMTTWSDEAGNQWGCYKSSHPNAKTLVLGSHLDTVPNSGKYDGILGVLLPVSLIKVFNQQQRSFPFNIEIVGFGDEEGTRFGTTLLGSRAIAGTWQDKWAALTDQNQISLAHAMRDFGLDVNAVQNAARNPDDIIGFLEAHIEQGPVLEANDLPVGIVNAIAGARRFKMEISGSAGHAGTVPMEMRKDAMVCASEMVLEIERIANEHGVLATVGSINAKPNAVNVICGYVQMSLDIRSDDDEKRDSAVVILQQRLAEICAKRNCKFAWQQTHSAPSVQCDAALSKVLVDATESAGFKSFVLGSGAGHDAMAMAKLCPVSMLFIRCENGISHNPREAVLHEDVEAALKVVENFIISLARKNQID
jgi:allantoate deiminase